TGIPHAGLAAEVAAARALDRAADHVRVADLVVDHGAAGAVLPWECEELARELGYTVAVTWSPTAGLMDAVFVDTDEPLSGVYVPAGPLGALADYVNDPAANDRVEEIRHYLAG